MYCSIVDLIPFYSFNSNPPTNGEILMTDSEHSFLFMRLMQYNNFNRMDDFQSGMNLILKSLLRLGELHLSLFGLSNIKILNCEQLSQSPYIADELALARADLQPIKNEIEINCQEIKQTIDHLPQHHHRQQQAILSRVVSRILESVSSSPCELELEYYQYYNQRFRTKCTRILEEMAAWEISEVARVLYKYFRHIVLIELERYEEILECLAQTDFQSIKYFRQYFYSVLQKKESKRKEVKAHHIQSESFTPPHASKQQAQTQPSSQSIPEKLDSLPSSVPPESRPVHHHSSRKEEATSQPARQQLIQSTPPAHGESEKNEGFAQQQQFQTQTESPCTLPSVSSVPKAKNNVKSLKKMFSLLSSVMDLKKEYHSDITSKFWEERSLYSELVGRNKTNHHQINNYYHYSQFMSDHLNRTDPKSFYYFQEEAENEQHADKVFSEKKHVKVVIPVQKRENIFTIQPKRKEPFPALANPLEKRKEPRTIHKSIDCKPKIQIINAENKEVIEQKPLKIDSEFLEINLRKIIPARRMSQMQQMVSRASSLTALRHELHYKVVKKVAESTIKADNNDIFKSVRILHQGELNPQRQAKVLKEIKERLAEHSHHHDRIENRIKEQLKHADMMEVKSDELKRRMIFKKMEL